MRTMKATMQHKKCGGGPEANHNDRSFDVSKADNIGDIRKDSVWIFPEGQNPQRIRLENHGLKNFELAYYESRFGPAIEAQRERHLKARQKSRAEGCTIRRYYDSKKTGPESTILQVGKEWEYIDKAKFVKMLNAAKKEIEEENEEARIKVLSVSIHCSEKDGSMHAHFTKSFEYKGKDGWVQDTEKCLEKLGYKLPNEEKEKDRYNNRKMSWSAQKMQAWYDIIERIDPEIKIDREPSPDNPKSKGKVNRTITQMNELKKIIREIATEIEALQADLAKIGKEISKADAERRLEALQASLERHKIVFGKMQAYIGEGEKVPKKTAKKAAPVEEQDEEMER